MSRVAKGVSTSPRGDEVWILAYHMTPTRGLERATAALCRVLSASCRVTLVVLRGEVPDVLAEDLAGTRVLRGTSGWLRCLARLLTGAGPVVAAGMWAGAALRPVHRLARSPIVGWEHTFLASRHAEEPAVARIWQLARPVWRHASLVICVSDAVSDALAQVGVPSRTVIHNPRTGGVRSTRRRIPADAGAEVILLSIGALIPRKRHWLAIDALAELPLNCRLVIAGAGPEENALRARAARNGLDRRVDFVGHVESVGPLLKRATILVHCAKSETYGLVVVEAADAGVPVVAADAAGINELVPSIVPGCLVQPTSSDIAAAVHQVVLGGGIGADAGEVDVRRDRVLADDAIGRRWAVALGTTARRGMPQSSARG